MFLIWQLHKKNLIPASLPVILDSPMGARALNTFNKYPEWHKLTEEDSADMKNRVHIVESFKETWKIIDDSRPKVIIAGSGMVTGGRVLTYLQQYIGREETTVLLAGFQAEGTRGRQLLDGAEEIKFYGKYHQVKAHIDILHGLSAHADQTELLDWISDIKKVPEHVFLVHGESQSLDMMRVKLKDTYNWEAYIPELYEIADIQL
ncbi:MBL fold metallo-hydrolase RNA specificity domain-containing protein [Gracilimonas halophila]|uniref:MBL fold metallo-hydrolase RNA specificity domain-containing protein n=1 Tax=Gracilimonas halophila TaxID=1834464 RepID=A0ABW5JI84_9BACT